MATFLFFETSRPDGVICHLALAQNVQWASWLAGISRLF